jgi:dTDP-4-amino-4,6-dideoxygalactose transaminase
MTMNDLRASLAIDYDGPLIDVPFLDLHGMHASMKDDILADVADLIDTSAFSNGPAVVEFEGEFARYCGTSSCVGVASGLDALRLALIAAGIEAGDEVIVPANTFIATVEAVTQAGGRPVLVDASENDYNLDPAAAEAAVTPRSRFLLPVHLYGQLADMRALGALARRHGLGVLEDACQAHGGERDGIRAGTSGFAAAFSFYPGKNLGAFGDAGGITTNDAELTRKIRSFGDHGRRAGTKHEHEYSGRNSRLDALQAAILSIKLKRLDKWNAARRAASDLYRTTLEGTDCRVLGVVPGSTPVHHLEVIRVSDRASVTSALDAHGIGWGLHYPIPCHHQDPFTRFAHGPYIVTERAAGQIVSVPMFPTITRREVERVCEILVAATQGSASGTGT